MLSGYLISGSILRLLAANVWSWPSYLLHRVLRLWIVLIPALFLGIFWDDIGLHLTNPGAVLLYTGRANNHTVTGDIHGSYNVASWFGTLFFLHGSLTSTFGSSGQLWSLANEFWYYILFPLTCLAVSRRTTVTKRAMYATLFLAVMFLISREIKLLFPVWLMGSVLAKLRLRMMRGSIRLLATMIWVPSLVAAEAMQGSGWYLSADYFFGFATTAYLWILLSAFRHEAGKGVTSKMFRTLARFSYTLYAVHAPPMLVAAGLTVGLLRWTPDLPHLMYGAAIGAGLTLYAFCVAVVTEFQTDRVRHWIEEKVPWTAPHPRS